MHSPNKPKMTAAEREHVERLKAMQWCACTDEPCDPEIHEIKQGDWWTAIPLSADAHRGSFNGLHGQGRAWKLRKLTELGALSRTIQRLVT